MMKYLISFTVLFLFLSCSVREDLLKYSELIGTKWQLEDLAGKGIIDRTNVTIHFGKEGELSGKGGCNQYQADYTLVENKLTIDAIISTEMACATSIMEQENYFFNLLQEAETVEYDDDFLLIHSAAATTPLRLIKIEEEN